MKIFFPIYGITFWFSGCVAVLNHEKCGICLNHMASTETHFATCASGKHFIHWDCLLDSLYAKYKVSNENQQELVDADQAHTMACLLCRSTDRGHFTEEDWNQLMEHTVRRRSSPHQTIDLDRVKFMYMLMDAYFGQDKLQQRLNKRSSFAVKIVKFEEKRLSRWCYAQLPRKTNDRTLPFKMTITQLTLALTKLKIHVENLLKMELALDGLEKKAVWGAKMQSVHEKVEHVCFDEWADVLLEERNEGVAADFTINSLIQAFGLVTEIMAKLHHPTQENDSGPSNLIQTLMERLWASYFARVMLLDVELQRSEGDLNALVKSVQNLVALVRAESKVWDHPTSFEGHHELLIDQHVLFLSRVVDVIKLWSDQAMSAISTNVEPMNFLTWTSDRRRKLPTLVCKPSVNERKELSVESLHPAEWMNQQTIRVDDSVNALIGTMSNEVQKLFEAISQSLHVQSAGASRRLPSASVSLLLASCDQLYTKWFEVSLPIIFCLRMENPRLQELKEMKLFLEFLNDMQNKLVKDGYTSSSEEVHRLRKLFGSHLVKTYISPQFPSTRWKSFFTMKTNPQHRRHSATDGEKLLATDEKLLNSEDWKNVQRVVQLAGVELSSAQKTFLTKRVSVGRK